MYCLRAVFGILEGRFWLHKTPVLYHKKVHVNNRFLPAARSTTSFMPGNSASGGKMEWSGALQTACSKTTPTRTTPSRRSVRARGLVAAPRRVESDDGFSSIGCMSLDSSLGVLLGTPVSDPSTLDLGSLVSLHTETEGLGFEDLQTKLVANFAWP